MIDPRLWDQEVLGSSSGVHEINHKSLRKCMLCTGVLPPSVFLNFTMWKFVSVYQDEASANGSVMFPKKIICLREWADK